MNRAEANALIAYARGLDALVTNSEPQVDTWANALTHVPLEAGKLIVSDYYGKHPRPDERKPITAAHVRKLFYTNASAYHARRRALGPPRDRKGGPPPRRFIEEMQSLGMLSDRDPATYRD